MSDKDLFTCLAERLTCANGTILYPKADGRVEIPQSFVRLMGWKDKGRIKISLAGPQKLCLVEGDRMVAHQFVGSVVVSMERVRIPASMLRKIGLDKNDRVVVIPQISPGDPCLIVVPDLSRKIEAVRQVFLDIGQKKCEWLAGLVDVALQVVPKDEGPPVSHFSDLPQAPRLFFPSPFKPTIIRVIGKPFAFRAHWVAAPASNGGGGTFVAHKDDLCQLCKVRGPERIYLIPVLRRGVDADQVGFLLVKEELRTVIGRALYSFNPTSFDLILYYKPFSYGMFDVFRNPPEPIPESVLDKAQESCVNPDAFLDSVFKEIPAPFVQDRSPAVLVKRNFALGLVPDNFEE